MQLYLWDQTAGGTCRQWARSRALRGAAADAAGGGRRQPQADAELRARRAWAAYANVEHEPHRVSIGFGNAEQLRERVICCEEPSRARISAPRSWRRAPQRRTPRAPRRSARWRRAACATRRWPPPCTTATTRPTPGARRGRGPLPCPALERALQPGLKGLKTQKGPNGKLHRCFACDSCLCGTSCVCACRAAWARALLRTQKPVITLH